MDLPSFWFKVMMLLAIVAFCSTAYFIEVPCHISAVIYISASNLVLNCHLRSCKKNIDITFLYILNEYSIS